MPIALGNSDLSAPKILKSVFGNVILPKKIVDLDAPNDLKISLYSGSKVDKPIETETAIGKRKS